MKDLLKDFVPYPPFIDKDFLDGNRSKFISEYEIHLIGFIEWKRIWGELQEYDIIGFEKEFIETTAGYLLRKNEINFNFTEENEEKIQREFSKKTDIPIKRIKEALIDEDQDSNDDLKLNRNYVDFLKTRVKTTKEKTIEREIESYNYKIHYLTLRAHRIGFNAIFGDEIAFNKLKRENKPESKDIKFNISERFQILNKSIGLWRSISEQDLTDLKKYELLALTLGINKSNAQKLVNGTYNTKDRPEKIESYLREML